MKIFRRVKKRIRRIRKGRTLSWTFFQQWLRNPLSVAAISPSSKELAQKMMTELPANTQRVIELGAGTGVFTQALLERGIPAKHLLVVELNESLTQYLHKRFPNVLVVCGDARYLEEIVVLYHFHQQGLTDAVISGLGFLSMAKSLQYEILKAAFAVLKTDGYFIQFTYGPMNPIAREVMQDLNLESRRAGYTLWNIPPAVVYVITRKSEK